MRKRISKSHPRRMRRKTIKKIFFVGLLAFFMFCIGIGIGGFMILDNIFVKPEASAEDGPSLSPEDQKEGNPDIVNILFLGIDGWGKGSSSLSGGGNHRTDTMILMCFNKKTKDLNLISVPRDTRVTIEGSRNHHDKINAAFVYGGPDLARSTVANILNVDIPYYVVTNYAGFRRIVDIIGGVDYNVEKRMYYLDPVQNLLIDLQKGQQHLNGAKAEQYVRYRADGLGDIGRIARQQKFIQAVLDKLLRPSMIPKYPAILGEMTEYVRTNVSPGEMIKLGLAGGSIDKESIQTIRLPGNDGMIGGGSYWLADRVKVEQLIESIYSKDKQKESDIKQIKEQTDFKQVTLEIQNGNGHKGQAAILQKEFEKKGFKVKEVGNADHFYYSKSQIYYKPGFKKASEAIEKAIGSAELIEDDKIKRDVLIIIGENYTG